MKKVICKSNVTVFQSELYKTNSTVIQTNDCILVVDPTWLPSEIEAIQHDVCNIKCEKPVYLLFTHSDYDHILGYGAFPDAVTIGSEVMNNRSDKANIIEQIIKFDHEYYLDRTYSIEYPTLQIIVKHDRECLVIGDTKLTFYHAKGHTDDGIFVIVEPLGIFIMGDYCSDVEFPYIYSSSKDYEETLAKIDSIVNEHALSLIIPGHGTVTESVEELMIRKQQSLKYIQQLRDRIEKNTTEESFAILESYRYPKAMRKCHQSNIDLIKSELSEEKN
ncbi:MBL fold metallo-hydrolase [Bacillus sp. JJ722]|uniref:MBL fold metallo-hydrolase n=1 Tax=Bacillus sp. JJ722 TaxID=3122973 RepID=UPI002FFE1BDA